MKVLIDGIEYIPAVEDLPEGYLSPHFRVTECNCNHCGQYGEEVDMDLIAVLEDVRTHFGGVPVTINSCVRCDFHNQAVGGASNSRHKVENADAADIVVSGIPSSNVADYLESKDPGKWGIGRYPTFTHIDTRGQAARWNG